MMRAFAQARPAASETGVPSRSIVAPYAKGALPALLEGMQSTNYRVRHLAALALPAIGYNSPEYVPPLLRLLSDRDATVRRQALDSLADFGPLGIAALPQARRSLHDTNGLTHAAALMFFDKVLSDEEFLAVRDEVTNAKTDSDATVSTVAQFVLSRRPRAKMKFIQSQWAPSARLELPELR